MGTQSMLGKFVVGWDLPMGMPQGVMRLVNLQEPAWTCLFCTPCAFAKVQDDWQSMTSATSVAGASLHLNRYTVIALWHPKVRSVAA